MFFVFFDVKAYDILPPGDEECPPFTVCDTTPPPTAPGSVSVPSVNLSGSFTLNWETATGFVGSGWYEIEESVDSGSYTNVESSFAPSNSIVLSGKNPALYTYRVRACNQAGDLQTNACSSWTVSPVLRVNKPPVSNAGPNVNTNENTTASLSGSGSDSDGSITSYNWIQTSGSPNVSINNSTQALASFIAPNVSSDQVLTFQLTVTDNDGITASDSVSVTVKNVNELPHGSISFPSNGQVFAFGESITVDANAADSDGSLSKVTFQLDGMTKCEDTTAPYSCNVGAPEAGTHTLKAVAYDNENATQTSQINIIVEPPNQAPTVSLTSPVNDQNFQPGASITMHASASDSDGAISKVSFLLNGIVKCDDVTAPYSCDAGVPSSGTYALKAVAYDNDNATTEHQVIVRSMAEPSVSISSPAESEVFQSGTSIIAQATASDTDGSITKVAFLLDGVTKCNEVAAPFSCELGVPTEGNHTLKVIAYDNEDLTQIQQIGFYVEGVNNAPSVSVTSPADGQIFEPGASIILQAVASDSDGNISKVAFLFNGVTKCEDITAPYSCNVGTPPSGSHIVKAVAYDNDSTTASHQVDIEINKSPLIAITSPIDGQVFQYGTPIIMQANASDIDGTVSKVAFILDGVTKCEDTIAPYSCDIGTTSIGAHTLKATVYDDGGLSLNYQITISVEQNNSPPIITGISGGNGHVKVYPAGHEKAGEFYTGENYIPVFEVSATDPEGDALSYEWSIIDGSMYWESDLSSVHNQAYQFRTLYDSGNGGNSYITIRIAVTDSNGLVSTLDKRVHINNRPEVSILAHNAAGQRGNHIEFASTQNGLDFSGSLSDEETSITRLYKYVRRYHDVDKVWQYWRFRQQQWTNSSIGTHQFDDNYVAGESNWSISNIFGENQFPPKRELQPTDYRYYFIAGVHDTDNIAGAKGIWFYINAKPTITAQQTISLEANSSLTMTTDMFTLSDQDDAAGFTLKIATGNASCSVENYQVNGLVVQPVPDFSGTINVPVSVNDGTEDSDVYCASVTINSPPPPPNSAPSFTSTPVKSVDENQNYQYTVTTQDFDEGDQVNLQLTMSQAWLSFVDNGDGTAILSGTPSIGDVGSFLVEIEAIDSLGEVATQSFTLIVNEDASTGAVPDWANSETVSVADSALVTPYVAPQQSVGAIEGQGGVSGGAASYSIPISLPPGRAGMQPNVSLNYSSRSGNSTVGMGWSLSASSSINRCGKTVAQDGINLSVQYNNDDRLCYNGQRLIAVSGNYGVNGTVYHTEIDSFARVTQYADNINSDNSTAWFKVEHNNGLISEYGNTPDSRVTPDGAPTVLSWQINQETDRSKNKNSIVYVYYNFGFGEQPIKEIQYTGSSDRRVEFHYQDRTDFSSNYLAGGLTRQTRLLESITTHYLSNTIRRYELSYNTSQASERSLLTGVTECSGASGGKCLPATTMTWLDSKPSYVMEKVGYMENGALVTPFESFRRISHLTPRGDENGDGVADWATWYSDAEGNKVADRTDSLHTCERNPLSHRISCLNVDFNQDGKTDNWRHYNDLLQISYSDGFGTLNWTDIDIPMGLEDIEFVANIADYNGDGWPDIVIERSDTYDELLRHDASTGSLFLYLHTGDPSAPYTATGSNIYSHTTIGELTNAFRDSSVQFMGDMDGNGLPDFVESTSDISNGEKKPVEQPTPRNLYLTKINSTGDVYFEVVDLSAHATGSLSSGDEAFYFHFFMDINGDGMQDWISKRGLLQYSLNKGGSFSEWETLQNGGGESWLIPMRQVPIQEPVEGITFANYPRYSASYRQYDYDADGRAELLVPGNYLAKACQTVIDDGVEVTRCGEELYDIIDNQPGGLFSWSMLDTGSLDDSVFQYNAIKFTEGADGIFSAQVIPTELVGSATQTATFDAYGNGLEDLVFTYGCQVDQYNCQITEVTGAMTDVSEGAYIMRNRGSATGSERYEPTDMLTSVENGLGYKDEWIFRPLSSRDGRFHSNNNPFYEPDFAYLESLTSDEQKAYFHFTSSTYVVAKHSFSNGTGGLSNRQYRYNGAMYSREGRGFQGFRTIIADNPTGIRSVTDFHQVFPKSGEIESTRTCLVGADSACRVSPISQSDYEYFDKTTASDNVHWIVPVSVKAEAFALNNPTQQLSRAVTTINPVDTDMFGNVLKSMKTVDDGFGKQEIQTTYNYNATAEWMDKLDGMTVITQKLATSELSGLPWDVYTNNAMSDNVKIVVSNFGYDPKGSRKVSSGSVTGIATVLTEYNDYGLAKEISTGGSRVVSMTYTPDGYFVNRKTGPTGVVTTNVNPYHGQPDSVIDINGFVTNFDYDDFGRIETNTPAYGQGQPTEIRYASCANCLKSGVAYTVTSVAAGLPDVTEYKDILNRTLVTRTQKFDGEDVYVSVDYNNLGQKTFESVPSSSANGGVGTSYNSYDELGRLTGKTTSYGLSMTYTHDQPTAGYGDYTTRIDVNDGDRVLYRTYSGTGRLMQTTDALTDPGITQYAYDGAGNPVVLRDANGAEITATYNALGQKLNVNDPNMGVKNFSYTIFGEVESETDASGNTIGYSYDDAGRMISRTGSGIAANFYFDKENNASDKCFGLPSREVKGAEFSRSYHYNNHCHLTSVRTVIDGEEYQVNTQIDGTYVRPKAVTYPSGLTLAYEYTDNGYLKRIYNAASGYTFRDISAVDSQGNWTTATYANNKASISRAFSAATGQMTGSTWFSDSSEQQQLTYSYDGYSNLKQQKVDNYWNGLATKSQEDYLYDKMHRLTQTSRTIPGFGTLSTNFSYDAVGNIKKKTDFSADDENAYAYLPVGSSRSAENGYAGPNAVRSVQLANNGGTRIYTYDQNGNLTGDGLRSIQYNAFNKPTQITVNIGPINPLLDSQITQSSVSQLYYAANQMRYKQVKSVNGETSTHIYIDKLYEVITKKSNTNAFISIEKKNYIDDIAVVTEKSNASNDVTYDISYFHRDRLGSMTAEISELGQIQKGHSYDAFGRPGSVDLGDSTTLQILGGYNTNRGFTDHEHLDESQLIHMNGRVYDYNLGRFLSVDPFIQEPSNSQSINPYSYIMNNPLAGTDPSGYLSTSFGKEPVKEKESKPKIETKTKSRVIRDPMSIKTTKRITEVITTITITTSGENSNVSPNDVSYDNNEYSKRIERIMNALTHDGLREITSGIAQQQNPGTSQTSNVDNSSDKEEINWIIKAWLKFISTSAVDRNIKNFDFILGMTLHKLSDEQLEVMGSMGASELVVAQNLKYGAIELLEKDDLTSFTGEEIDQMMNRTSSLLDAANEEQQDLIKELSGTDKIREIDKRKRKK